MAVVKTAQDYYEQMFKEFPDVTRSDIKRICMYGLKSLYLINSFGCDTLIQRPPNFWFYCGSLMKDSLKYYVYYRNKMRQKIRLFYKKTKPEWDGYYYFGLSKKKYDEYLAQKNHKGRPKKNFKFSKVFMYKIYDECNLMTGNCVAIFKIYIGSDMGLTWYKENIVTDKAELVLEKDYLKFKDILLDNYDYQFKDDKKRLKRS